MGFIRHSKITFFYSRQYGFRKKSNTSTAATDLITDIQLQLDKGNFTAGVFLDLSKAFDTVNHSILLEKLEKAGIWGIPLVWFRSFLANRKQFVSLSNTHSEHKGISIGVPQGSVLGPILFLVYINIIGDLKLRGTLRLFADDSAIFYFGPNLQSLLEDMQYDLNILSNLLKINKLTLNANKTNYMIISTIQKNRTHNNVISIDGVQISEVNFVKFLGLYIDKYLKWDVHISNISKKVSPVVGILYKISTCIPQSVRRVIYFSLIHSHLQYLNIVWGRAYQVHLQQLKVLQNKAIKNI